MGQAKIISMIFPLQCVMVLEQAPFFTALARQQSATTTLAKSSSREEQFRGLNVWRNNDVTSVGRR